jgi:CrcB protein
MQRFMLVCFGGALGSGARYLVGVAAVRLFGLGFPVGTLCVNLIGSFLISLIIALSVEPSLVSANLRPFLTTGVMGGLTTYSAFNYEVLRLFEEGAWGRAVVYLLCSLLGCLALGGLGLLAGRSLVHSLAQ